MYLFLLRGLVREKDHWGIFVQQVKEAFPQYEIVTPEIQGVGEFYQVPSPDNLKAMVDFMREQHADKFGEGNKNMVMALSLGGMMSRCWMEHYPEDFEKAVLINTSFKGVSPTFKRLQPSAVATFAKLFATSNIGMRELGILRLVSNKQQRHQEIVKDWIEIQKQRPVARKSFVNQIKAALTYNPPLTAPKTRLLILAGAKDRLCHYSCSVDLYSRWGGTLKIHPDAGHDLPIDAPEFIIESVKEWI